MPSIGQLCNCEIHAQRHKQATQKVTAYNNEALVVTGEDKNGPASLSQVKRCCVRTVSLEKVQVCKDLFLGHSNAVEPTVSRENRL